MYTIGQVSKLFGLPVSTLRYYDKEGLFDNIHRESGIRKFSDKDLERHAKKMVKEYRSREETNKSNAGMSITIRKNDDDKSYLDMDNLANLVDKGSDPYRLSVKGKIYKPTRDAVMHTSLISDEAKRSLTTVLDEIKARIRNLLQ